MTQWVCKWKPFWVPRGDTFQKAYPEEWEQEDDDQNYIHGEESKNCHRSYSASRTTASEGLHTVEDDGGVPHAKYQLLVAVLPCRNRLGNPLVIPMSQQSSGSIHKLNEVQ